MQPSCEAEAAEREAANVDEDLDEHIAAEKLCCKCLHILFRPTHGFATG